MIVGPASLELVAMLGEGSGEGASVQDNLFRVILECRLGNLKEGSGDSSDSLKIVSAGKRNKSDRSYVIVGTTLTCGEDSLVDALLEVLGLLEVFPEEDETSTGSTKRLVAT